MAQQQCLPDHSTSNLQKSDLTSCQLIECAVFIHLHPFDRNTVAIRSKLVEEYATSTANKFLSALRGTLKASWQLGQMSAEDYHKAASVGGIKGETVPAGLELSGGEIAALLQACAKDPSPAGARDAAIIALLYACGPPLDGQKWWRWT